MKKSRPESGPPEHFASEPEALTRYGPPHADPPPPHLPVINFISNFSGAPTFEQIPVRDPEHGVGSGYVPGPGEITIKISREALSPIEVDMYVVPAERVAEFGKNRTGFGVPVIGYGPPSLLSLAFEAGCRDYLKDPWDYEELRARAFRFLRNRQFIFQWGKVQYLSSTLRYGKLNIELSPPEDHILSILSAHINCTVRREALQYALWGELRPGSRAVDAHVASLRKKFNLLAGKKLMPNPLRTVHGRGYSLIHKLSTPYSDCG